MNFVTINNAILDRDKVTLIWQDPKNVNRVTVKFDNGHEQQFEGAEAAELWKHFDDGGWRNDDKM